VTVMLDVPVFPELVAVIVAEPAATPVTTPLELTVAAAVLLLDHVTACPVITLPFWSFTVACSVVVAPATIDADVGAIVTVVTTSGTAVTVMLDVPVFPELVAVIVAEPAATPVTTPLELTVAAAVLPLDHVTVCPVITLPFWSFTVACSVVVAPATIDADVGASVTVVTTGAGGGPAVTVISDVPVTPELLAVIVAEPAATPVTMPLELTVAAAVLLFDHVTVCPVITLPFWSLTVACNGVVAPTATDVDAGETVTVVTTWTGGVTAWVELATTFESPPNAAFSFRIPRNATIWKL
jgi:hypothetical protein